MIMQVFEMAKKKPADGRRARNIPLSRQELEGIRQRLKAIAGVIDGACIEMDRLGLETIASDGKSMAVRGLDHLALFAVRAKGAVATADINDL